MRWIATRPSHSRFASRSLADQTAEFCHEVRQQLQHLALLTDAELNRASCDLREQGDLLKQDSTNQRFTNRTQQKLKCEAFGIATEAVRRTTGKVYYDVQLMAGHVLAEGHLAEMATGEGKTLVTLLPTYASVVQGNNVHVTTTNSYLAERDCNEVSPALELLGVRTALLPEENHDEAKRAAYACDVTYGTGYEFGFDYLRDQLLLRNQPQDALGESWLRNLSGEVKSAPKLVQSERNVTIVDEIDSVLIDEANTPLVISFFTDEKSDDTPYRLAANTADKLQDGIHYRIDTTKKSVDLEPAGLQIVDQVHRRQGGMKLQRPWRIYVEQALRARFLLQRDVDYVVQHGAVALVDQQTGRIFPERKWRDGLHQAIEFLEGTSLTAETNSFARISRQRFFQLYQQATGLTGTATDAADEFRDFFQLQVVPIPLHRPSARQHLPSRFFVDDEARIKAIVQDTAHRQGQGQPVLIGTRTILQSQLIGAHLQAAGIQHQILNGLQDAEEATVVSAAGEAGAVTVATNMAGRGTDIKLSDASRQAGGLHVVVAEPNRSCRVDRQLIGRAARQGDPGSCQTFVSATDDLLLTMNSSLVRAIRSAAKRDGEARRDFSPELLILQRQAERSDFTLRRRLLQQEFWVEGMLDKLVGSDI